MLFESYVRFHIFSSLRVTAFWEIVAHSVYDMFSWYKYLSVILVYSHPSVYGVGVSFCLRHFLIIAYLYLFISLLFFVQHATRMT